MKMEEDSLAVFFGICLFLNFLHTCLLTVFIMKLEKNKSIFIGPTMDGECSAYNVHNKATKMPNSATLEPKMMEDAEYADPLHFQEPKYAEVDLKKVERYDSLNFLQQNTKENLCYDKIVKWTKQN
ncbi:uncharacterized protein [Chironomus tepperi]|uniref:uncharacterized protein n=1 Tax=Chironomus tepperi TaxID=113505 RepID=UPI00391F94C0